MIPKKLYVNAVNSIIKLNELEDRLYDLGISCFDVQEIEMVKHNLEKILSYCTDDKYTKNIGTDLEYFLYELKGGKEPFAKNCINTASEVHWSLTTPDELFEYLKSQSYNIEDVNWVDDDPLAEYTED